MNILLSSYACAPNSGSEPGLGWNWAMHLAERGINVTVLTRSDGRKAIEAFLARNSTPNVTFKYAGVPSKLFKPATMAHYAVWQWLAVGVAKALHREKSFDLVHHISYTSIHVPTQLWRLGIPTIFGPIGGGQTAPPSMLEYFGPSKRSEQLRTLLTKALVYSPFHRRWIGKMTTVLAANSDTLELLRSMGRRDVRLVFDSGVTTDYLAQAPRNFASTSSPIRLIWVARMLPRKGLPVALDALARTRHASTLTLVGNGLEEGVVRQMIAERGLTGRIQWAGRRLTSEEVRAAYEDHDALFFTSLRETSGVQLQEAMALGLPVISLDLHGARDVVPLEAGIKVPVTTPTGVVSALAAAVDRFAEMSARQKNAMSEASWNFARRTAWPCRAAEAEILYREILGLERDCISLESDEIEVRC